jgi:LCP family protein required for cell wall assembly
VAWASTDLNLGVLFRPQYRARPRDPVRVTLVLNAGVLLDLRSAQHGMQDGQAIVEQPIRLGPFTGCLSRGGSLAPRGRRDILSPAFPPAFTRGASAIHRSRSHASPTARARRMRELARQEERLRAQGIDPYTDPRYAVTPDGTFVRVRRRPPIKRVLLLAVLILMIIAVVGATLLWQRVSAFNDTVSTAPMTSSALFGPLSGDEPVNVVLYGYGGPEQTGGTYLADSIQIISIDPKADTTTVIPIPRDLWVEGNPAIPNNGKINEAFAIGYLAGGISEAARFTTSLLSELTGLKLEHWLAIDFAGFRDMVDAVGGVTIVNPTAFSYTRDEASFHAGIFRSGSFAQGELHLDGQQALYYSRARYTSVPAESSDFARSVRQQRVLSALRAKLGEGGLASLGPGLRMMDALSGRMKTDLSAIDLFLLSGHLNPDRRIELKEGVILQATTNTDGEYILVVIGGAGPTDYTPLQAYLRTELPKSIPAPVPSGSGLP